MYCCAATLPQISTQTLEGLVLFEEDRAPAHVGDTDSITKATGLKQKRKEALRPQT